jgi:hypothetical protein
VTVKTFTAKEIASKLWSWNKKRKMKEIEFFIETKLYCSGLLCNRASGWSPPRPPGPRIRRDQDSGFSHSASRRQLAPGGADVEEKPGKDHHRRRHRSFWNARLELNSYSDKNVSKIYSIRVISKFHCWIIWRYRIPLYLALKNMLNHYQSMLMLRYEKVNKMSNIFTRS